MEQSPSGGFACTVANCSKSFRRKEHLTRHLKSHTSAQYLCHLCGRTYARSDVLRRHVQKHPPMADRAESPAQSSTRHSSTQPLDGENDTTIVSEPLRDSNSHIRQSPFATSPSTTPHQTIARALESPRVPDSVQNRNASIATQERHDPYAQSPNSLLDRRGNIVRASTTAQRLFASFFQDVNPRWAVLPCLDYETTSNRLIAAIALIPSWLENDQDHSKLVGLIMDQVAEAIVESSTELEVLQIICLYNLYAICRADKIDNMTIAANFHSMLISACRRAGIFNADGMWSDSESVTPDDRALAAQKLAFVVMRIDAYISLVFNTPPFLHCPEIKVPLVDSSKVHHGEDLHTASREHSFGLLVRRSIDPDFHYPDHERPNLNDLHLGLCAMQSNMWTISTDFINNISVQPNMDIDSELAVAQTCRRLLAVWWANNKAFLQLETNAILLSETRILYHASALRAYSPRSLMCLQRLLAQQESNVPVQAASRDLDLSCWMRTSSPRIAVWHAGQIARIVQQESKQVNAVLNTLIVPSLMKSAVVVCAYAARTRACPFCTGNPEPVDLVDAFSKDETCERLTRWISTGHGLCNWGGNIFKQMPICRCGIPIISAWYRNMFRRIMKADSDLIESFISLLSH